MLLLGLYQLSNLRVCPVNSLCTLYTSLIRSVDNDQIKFSTVKELLKLKTILVFLFEFQTIVFPTGIKFSCLSYNIKLQLPIEIVKL